MIVIIFKVNEKRVVKNTSFFKDKFTDLNKAKQIIKENVESIESKLNFIFKEVIVILDNFYCLPINVSGLKTPMISNIKRKYFIYLKFYKISNSENEKDKTIIHIFNSKSVLDDAVVDNLPIGLFGDFYNHELSFLLIKIIMILKIFIKYFMEANINIKKF